MTQCAGMEMFSSLCMNNKYHEVTKVLNQKNQGNEAKSSWDKSKEMGLEWIPASQTQR